ncbi:MAG: 2,3-bisphosphoglycerate-independent phosphoglycerate mutase, partial [Chloroflexi bacterium]|nr:2,3-bisphosphoglycerate-independent phosphoglycerate mutase [Chloroflexota bacterium]
MLVVLDGFGIGQRPEADAIAAAAMPTWRSLLAAWPHAHLEASGEAVGLPVGQMGNSEVGHLNIGAGRPVVQDLPRIDAAIADGSFDRDPVITEAMQRAATAGRRLHLITLVGPGGVHANDRHAVAIAALGHRTGVRDVVVHALLDGRDTPPRSAEVFLPDLERRLASAHPDARIASVGGRYFGMDRDDRWERTAAAYRAIVRAEGLRAASATSALAAAYERGENDEFVQPTVIDAADGSVCDGDVIVFVNFRADRARQLTHALVDGPSFRGFERGRRPVDVLVATMTAYERGLPVRVCYPPVEVRSLAQTFSELGWRQFHVAETEKYAHVTYFLNGGIEAPWPGEDRRLVPSPKVATYDLRPEMSAEGVTDALVDALDSRVHDFLVANYANADMVGHSGEWDATVAAVEFLDACLARVLAAFDRADARSRDAGGRGALLCITSDHGNADEKRDAAGSPVTAHSLNPVPILLAGTAARGLRLHDGV